MSSSIGSRCVPSVTSTSGTPSTKRNANARPSASGREGRERVAAEQNVEGGRLGVGDDRKRKAVEGQVPGDEGTRRDEAGHEARRPGDLDLTVGPQAQRIGKRQRHR